MKVLHVDDNKADLILIKEMLAKTPYQADLKQFDKLEPALEFLKNEDRAQHYIVLLDLGLPPHSGLEALELSLKAIPHLAVIVLTGLGNMELGQMAIKKGALEFLEKDWLNSGLLERALRNSWERDKLLKSLRESNQAKDKLLSLIGHDLRSPISAIIYLADLIEEDINNIDPNQLKEELEMIRKAANKANGLLGNLLAWARLQLGSTKIKLETLDLYHISKEVLSFFELMSKQKDVRIINKLKRGQKVRFDNQSLQVILRNLISNALKFSKPGSSIWLESVEEEDRILLRVIDEGIGIPNSFQEHIFGGSQTVGRQGTAGEMSSGLGLMLSKAFADKCGAKIGLESQEGKGSTFTLNLTVA